MIVISPQQLEFQIVVVYMILYSIRMKCVGHESGKKCLFKMLVLGLSLIALNLSFLQAFQRSCSYSLTSSNSHSILTPYYFGLCFHLMKDILLRSPRTSLANCSGSFHSSLKADFLAVTDTIILSFKHFLRVLLRQQILLSFLLSFHSLLLLKVNSPRTQSLCFLGSPIHFTCLALITTCIIRDEVGYNRNEQPQISMG